MDHSKLDAGLMAALEDAADASAAEAMSKGISKGGDPGAAGGVGAAALSVFVHLDPKLSKAEKEKLAKLGLPLASAQGGIATATLSPDQVRQLSEQPSVRQLRLSTPLRLLGNE